MKALHFLSPRGFRAGGVYSGIKSRRVNDVGVLACDAPTPAVAAFTTNKVFAAPIAVGRKHIAGGKLCGLVINSGNANACTGQQGLNDAQEMCRIAGAALRCPPARVLPGSTGIIGHTLPMEKLRRGIVEAAMNLGTTSEHSTAFNDAILTTDTRRKFAAAQLKLGGKVVTITGICKGAGMIGPRLALPPAATLAYLLTDASISSAQLRRVFMPAVNKSFNAVTIDDHMSTNDTAVLLASGASGVKVGSSSEVRRFSDALTEVCQSLAEQIAADGEGATKTVRIDVIRGKTDRAAETIARAIANSPLVKCAMHGNDPNWGRIVSAAGMCGVPFDPDRATLSLQGVEVFRKGRPAAFDPETVSELLGAKQVIVRLDCGSGKSSHTLWTCDMSEEYVSINADYHT